MYRLKMMKYHNITPIMVFDGGFLPAKHKEEHRRHGYEKSILLLIYKMMN